MAILGKKISAAVNEEVVENVTKEKVKPVVTEDQPDPNRAMSWFSDAEQE